MDIGWVKPWVTLGWVGLGPAKNLMFFLFIRYWFICYILFNCNSKQTQSHTSIENGTVSYT